MELLDDIGFGFSEGADATDNGEMRRIDLECDEELFVGAGRLTSPFQNRPLGGQIGGETRQRLDVASRWVTGSRLKFVKAILGNDALRDLGKFVRSHGRCVEWPDAPKGQRQQGGHASSVWDKQRFQFLDTTPGEQRPSAKEVIIVMPLPLTFAGLIDRSRQVSDIVRRMQKRTPGRFAAAIDVLTPCEESLL